MSFHTRRIQKQNKKKHHHREITHALYSLTDYSTFILLFIKLHEHVSIRNSAKHPTGIKTQREFVIMKLVFQKINWCTSNLEKYVPPIIYLRQGLNHLSFFTMCMILHSYWDVLRMVLFRWGEPPTHSHCDVLWHAFLLSPQMACSNVPCKYV